MRLRSTTSFGLMGALLSALVLALPTVAQDESIQTSDHPIVGSWIVDAETEPTPGLNIFAPDGTMFENRSPGPVGVWSPTSETGADVLFHVPVEDPEAGFVGFGTTRASVEVAENGQSWSGTYTFEPPAAMAEAMGLPVGELGPVEVTAQRITLEPMGEPVASMPDFSAVPAE